MATQRPSGLPRGAASAASANRFPARAARAPAAGSAPDFSTTYVFELGASSPEKIAGIIRNLRSEPEILFAEEDKVVRVFYVPNDPEYPLPDPSGNGFASLWGLKKIDSEAAWNVTQGEGVTVAVIDSGVDYDHPDLSANIWENPAEIAGNGFDDDQNGFIDDVQGWDFVGTDAAQPVEDNDPADVHGHGTHVAGTVAATGDNNLGVVGVSWKAKVMIVRGLDDRGIGYDSDLVRAIVYAVDNGADVINASWGRNGFSQALTDAVNYAHANGVVFVAAAGNEGNEASTFVPANIAHAITVAATTPGDGVPDFSNFGSKIDVAAPGTNILSLEANTAHYARREGTSMAAPHVSGVAALVLAQHPSYSNEQVRQILRLGAVDLGTLGKDSSYGYGLLNAAGSLAMIAPLAVKIISPPEGTALSAPAALTGSAYGPDFDHYVVDFGPGEAPATWTTISTNSTSVVGGHIGTLNTTTLPDGLYTVRLRAFTSLGTVFSDQIQVRVRYLEVTSPASPRVYAVTQPRKPGASFSITGSARGPSFQNFQLEWAQGANATTGWSNTGVTLTNGGSAPVTDGVLATWTPPEFLQGDYSLRLTVTNSGFTSAAATAVYFEPALLLHQLVGAVDAMHEAKPVRLPNGDVRFIVSGFHNENGTLCYSLGLDGMRTTVPLDFGGAHEPCVGNVDGDSAEEIVLADGAQLKILSSDLQNIRTITTTPARVFWTNQTILADLDNDGVAEIIAPAHDTSSPLGASYRRTGALYVYRGDGTLYSPNYPISIASPLIADGTFSDAVLIAAADLDGDYRKEVVMVVQASDYSGYTVYALNADGSQHAGWTVPSVPHSFPLNLAAADLDGDGRAEIILVENDSNAGSYNIRVFNGSGATRSGWPQTPDLYDWGAPRIAIGDLDNDGSREIVATTNFHTILLRGDGTEWSPPWQIGFANVGAPLIADTDGDGTPEIISTQHFRIYGTPEQEDYTELLLTVYALNGTIKQRWPLFGAEGQQPTWSKPIVGDFNNDGLTDVVTMTGVVAGGKPDGFINDGVMTAITTGTTFNPSRSEWAGRLHDPQNSRSANSAPRVTLQPTDQTIFFDSPVSFKAAAIGNAIPSFQWRKNGALIPGATSSTLSFAHVAFATAGSYDVVVTNALGTATSQAASLTVTKAPATVTLSGLSAIYDGTPKIVTATTNPSGKPVAITYNSSNTAPTLPGSYNVVATIEDPHYNGTASGTLVITDSGPVVTTHSANRTLLAPGGNATLSVTVAATGSPTYQWYHDGRPVSGATTGTLALAAATTLDQGAYWVAITSPDGTSTPVTIRSAPFFVQLAPAASQVVGWGFPDSSVLRNIPAGLTTAIALAAGDAHALALKSDGTVAGWGDNNYGQSTIPSGLTEVVAIAAAGNRSLALKSDGTVVAWGEYYANGQLVVPSDLNNVVALADSLALRSDGTLVTWRPISNDPSTLILTAPGGLVDMSSGAAIYGLKADGTVLAWNFGQTTPTPSLVPAGLSGVRKISSSGSHSLALKTDGTVKDWGLLWSGEATTPGGVSGVTAISAGPDHSLVLKSNGTIQGWGGYNAFGQGTPPAGLTQVFGLAAGSNWSIALRDRAGDTAPIVGTQPLSQTKLALESVAFSVAVSGTAPLTYQWRKNTVNISGANSATLTLTNLTTTAAGSYDVVVTNYLGSVTSNAATLTVDRIPVTFGLNVTSFTYSGSTQGPTVTAAPAGATFTTGGTLSAVNAGSYIATATATGNYTGSNSALSWTIAKATQSPPVITSSSSVRFGNTYVGTANPGLGFGAVEWTLGAGSSATNAAVTSTGFVSATTVGTVVIKARYAGDGNHLPSAYSADFVVTLLPIPATFSAGSTTLIYNGMPQSPTIVASPVGTTYTATGNSATDVGSYTTTVTATGNYSGSESFKWSVAKAGQSITFSSPSPGTMNYGTAPIPLVASASSGLPVTFTVVGGPATIEGVNLLLNGTGSVVVRASQAGNGNYLPAAFVDREFTVVNPYVVTTVAGAAGGGSADGTGSAAQFNRPNGVAVDGAGNVYVADTLNHTVRKITPAGVVTTLAGTAGEASYTDGTGNAARLWEPVAPTCDAAGNVYVFTSHQTIRKITPAGVVTTLAGKWDGGIGSADGTGSEARFYGVTGLAADSGGNVYAADYANHTIRKVTAGGVVTTLAGSAGNSGSADGTGANARFYYPYSLTVAADGNLYVADYGNYVIRKVTPAGEVTTLADQSGKTVRFGEPRGVTADDEGNLYVTDSAYHTVHKIVLSSRTVTTFAGSAGKEGFADGISGTARFRNPWNVAVDAGGTLYVISFLDHLVRKITAAGVVSSFAGRPSGGTANGTGSAAQFLAPGGVAFDAQGNAYVADTDNHVIRKIDPSGVVSTFAGSPLQPGSADGVGAAARFNKPYNVAVDPYGNVYVADLLNGAVRKITPAREVSTLATNVAATALAFDPIGNLYVADSSSNTILKIAPDGVLSLFAGSPNVPGTADGTGSAARFYSPRGIAVDGWGVVYVADTFNHTIRKITPDGVVTTFSGLPASSGYDDGMASRYVWPQGIAVDGAGYVYVSDNAGNRIRRLDASGAATTIAGPLPLVGGAPGSIDGFGNDARFNRPQGLAVNGAGTLYIADTANNTIRKAARLPVLAISSEPGDQTVLVGTPVGFTVTVTGFANPSYQWRKDGANIPGAIGSTYSIVSASEGDSADYSVVVFNADGIVTSAPAKLIAHPDLEIPNTSTKRQVVAPGENVTFSVDATGSGTLSYQWTRNGHPVSGATASSLHISSAATADSGWYTVLVTDAYRTLRSAPFFLTVAPTITHVVGWGSNSEGQTTVPSVLTDAVAIAAGDRFAVAIRRNGTLVQWGRARNNGADVAVTLANVTALAANGGGARAVRADGTVATWGLTSLFGTVPTDLNDAVGVATTTSGISVALRSDGTLVSWGAGSYGEQNFPADLANVVAVAGGAEHMLALKSDGTVVAWGRNHVGQATVPTGLSGVIAIAAGADHSLALKADGTVAAWGTNTNGQNNLPAGLSNVIGIADSLSSFALKSDGTVIAWGDSLREETIVPAGLTGALAIATYASSAYALCGGPAPLPPSITSQPKNATVNPRQPFTFTIIAEGEGLSYQWQIKQAGGSAWSNLTDGGGYSGTHAASLQVADVSSSQDSGDQFRCIVSNFSGAETSVAAILTVAAAPSSAKSYADVDGDGRAEVLWRNVNTGQIASWTSTAGYVHLGYEGSGWLAIGSDDFDGDGRADVLWRNANTGQIASWTSTAGYIHLGYEGSGWLATGTDDFEGDGRAEVLWCNTDTGQIASWTSTVGYIHLGYEGSGWLAIGTDDFDGDGRAEVLWRNGNTGQIASWTSTVGYIHLGYEGSGWVTFGTDDIDGDGRDEVVWRNVNTGQIASWTSTAGYLHLGYEGSGWLALGSDDFDGDGRAEVIWRNANTGQIASWTSTTGYTHLGYGGSGWTAAGN